MEGSMQLPHGSLVGTTRRVGLAAALVGTAAAVVLALPLASPTAIQHADAAEAGATGQQAAVKYLSAQGVPADEAARRIAAQPGQAALAGRLTGALGARTAGSFLDPATGALVVNVLDQAAAKQVTAGGAKARVVGNSTAKLDAIKAQLDKAGAVPNTSWSVDVVNNVVTVQMPSGTPDAATTALLGRLRAFGSQVRVERVDGRLSTQAFFGGQAIFGGSSRCSSAFNAKSGDTFFVITAGHCTRAISTWRTNNQTIGTSVAKNFPGDDYGTIRVNNPTSLDPRPAVLHNNSTRSITGFSSVPVGSTVCKTGSTTGTTCGTVQAYNVTVNYAEGSVGGLIRTNVCTQPGDSGGALYADTLAQGIVSGGTVTGCNNSGFRSFFQPVDEVLSALGLTLLS
jgi:hypothetical protein